MTTRAPRTSSAFAVANPMPLAAPVIAMVLPLMLSMRPNFTGVKFCVEVVAGNPPTMATAAAPELKFVMTYVVRTGLHLTDFLRGLSSYPQSRVHPQAANSVVVLVDFAKYL